MQVDGVRVTPSARITAALAKGGNTAMHQPTSHEVAITFVIFVIVWAVRFVCAPAVDVTIQDLRKDLTR